MDYDTQSPDADHRHAHAVAELRRLGDELDRLGDVAGALMAREIAADETQPVGNVEIAVAGARGKVLRARSTAHGSPGPSGLAAAALDQTMRVTSHYGDGSPR